MLPAALPRPLCPVLAELLSIVGELERLEAEWRAARYGAAWPTR